MSDESTTGDAYDAEWEAEVEAMADWVSSVEYREQVAEEQMERGAQDHLYRAYATPAEVAERDRLLAEAQSAIEAARANGDRAAMQAATDAWEAAWWTDPADGWAAREAAEGVAERAAQPVDTDVDCW